MNVRGGMIKRELALKRITISERLRDIESIIPEEEGDLSVVSGGTRLVEGGPVSARNI